MYIHKQNINLTIFYTASYFGKKTYQKQYDLVRRTIESFDELTLISPEAGNYMDALDQQDKQNITDQQLLHYEAIKAGIRKADATIIEVSHEDLQLGHEVSLALAQKKPILCLSINEDFSKRIHNDYFFGAKYTESNVKPIIQDFLAKVRERSLSKRFNLFLYPEQIEYLEKVSKEHKMNVSEYIRRLINLDKKAAEHKG
ncbi:MAG: hypothetical protein ACR2LN_05300 [Candidatus Levyibacteriota bacterium]